MIKIRHLVEFDFKDREAADLEKLNRVLSAMKLKDLELNPPGISSSYTGWRWQLGSSAVWIGQRYFCLYSRKGWSHIPDRYCSCGSFR